jgi:hypothetical protein
MPKKSKDPAAFKPSYKRLLQVLEHEFGREPSKSEAAKRLNVSPQLIGSWEDRGVSCAQAIAAEMVLGCSPAWLIHGHGEPMPRRQSRFTVSEPPAPAYNSNVVAMPQMTPMAVITELGRLLGRLESEEHRRAVAGTLASFANSGGNPLFHKMLLAAFDSEQTPPNNQVAAQS